MKGLIPQLLEDIAEYKKTNSICQIIQETHTQRYQLDDTSRLVSMPNVRESADKAFTTESNKDSSRSTLLETTSLSSSKPWN